MPLNACGNLLSTGFVGKIQPNEESISREVVTYF